MTAHLDLFAIFRSAAPRACCSSETGRTAPAASYTERQILAVTCPATCPCCWLAQTWGMYFRAVFIIMLIFVPVYKASVDPTIYGAKKKKSKMSGETVKKALQASKKA